MTFLQSYMIMSFSFCGPCFLHSCYIIHLSKTLKGERDSNILQVLDFHPRFLEALGSHKGAQRLLLWEEGVSRRWAGSHPGHAEQVGTTVGYTSYHRSREPCSPLISCKKFTEPGGFARALIRVFRWLSGKESACQCRRCRRCWSDPWIGKIPCRRKWQSTPVFLLEESRGQKSLVGYGPWALKELDTIEQLSTHKCTHTHMYTHAHTLS